MNSITKREGWRGFALVLYQGISLKVLRRKLKASELSKMWFRNLRMARKSTTTY
jgi:hypothetical protein